MKAQLFALKLERKPLIEAETVARKIRPAIAGEDDGRLLTAFDGEEEARLSDVTEVRLGALHDELRTPRPFDAFGGHAIRLRRVPAVQIRGAKVVRARVLEHAVALFAAAAVHGECLFSSEEIRRAQRREV